MGGRVTRRDAGRRQASPERRLRYQLGLTFLGVIAAASVTLFVVDRYVTDHASLVFDSHVLVGSPSGSCEAGDCQVSTPTPVQGRILVQTEDVVDGRWKYIARRCIFDPADRGGLTVTSTYWWEVNQNSLLIDFPGVTAHNGVPPSTQRVDIETGAAPVECWTHSLTLTLDKRLKERLESQTIPLSLNLVVNVSTNDSDAQNIRIPIVVGNAATIPATFQSLDSAGLEQNIPAEINQVRDWNWAILLVAATLLIGAIGTIQVLGIARRAEVNAEEARLTAIAMGSVASLLADDLAGELNGLREEMRTLPATDQALRNIAESVDRVDRVAKTVDSGAQEVSV